MVGGALRDHLLGIESRDIDLVIDRDPKEVLRGKAFPLDEERGIYRLLWQNLTIDVSKMQGKSIEEDLLRRDYTVNALAYDIKGQRIIDPTGGLRDLKDRLLKPVSQKNLKEDPIRLLRGIRLWLHLPLKMAKKTERAISELSPLLQKSAPERIKDELAKIISHPVSHKAILLANRLKLLDKIFPEIAPCTGLFQGKFRGCDLKEHLIYCYQCAERIINFMQFFFPEEPVQKAVIREAEKGIRTANLIKIAALLHDIGKPETFRIQNDEYTFWGHDRLGGEMAKEAMERLKFSSKSVRLVSDMVANHMRLHLLARTGEITPRAKGRFFRNLKESAIPTVILSLADSWASSGDAGFFYLLRYARQMIDFYLEMLKEEKLQKPLLSGYEVMDILKIGPGPMVGRVLKSLLEEQTEGKIRTKEEAVKYVLEVFGNGQG